MTDTADIDALAEGLHALHCRALDCSADDEDVEHAAVFAATPPVAGLLRLAAVGRAVEGLRDSTTIEYDPSATDYPWCVDVGSGSKHGDGPDLPSAIRAALEGERS